MKFHVHTWDVINYLMRESIYDPPNIISFPVYFKCSSGIEMQEITVAIGDTLLTVESLNGAQ